MKQIGGVFIMEYRKQQKIEKALKSSKKKNE